MGSNKDLTHYCIGFECPFAPTDRTVAFSGGCPYYLGYNYCSNPEYGTKIK